MKPLAEPQSESRFTEMDGCSRMEHERLKSSPAKGLGFHPDTPRERQDRRCASRFIAADRKAAANRLRAAAACMNYLDGYPGSGGFRKGRNIQQDRSPGRSAGEGAHSRMSRMSRISRIFTSNKSPGVTAERKTAHVISMGPGENNYTSRKGKKQ